MSPRTEATTSSRLTSGLLIVVLVLVLAALGWFVGTAGNDTDYSPDNSGDNGTMAAAQVLAQHDVRTQVATTSGELDALDLNGPATVVVTEPDNLGRQSAEHLKRFAGDGRIVLLQPVQAQQEYFNLGLAVSTGTQADLAGACSDALFDELRLIADSAMRYAHSGCFTKDGDAVLAAADDQIFALGAAQVLTNGDIQRGDNAAIAFRLLGQHENLVWYRPNPQEARPSEGLGSDQVPDAFVPGLVLLLLIGGSVVFWRGRRLGPLATEPLPVTVKAHEAVLSRGRLYRKHSTQEHAANALTQGTLHRLRRTLAMPGNSSASDVALRITEQSQRNLGDTQRLLGVERPALTHDKELIQFAHELAGLEEEVNKFE